MGFQKGNQYGGAREGAGRKPNFIRARLDMLMRQSFTDEDLLNFLEMVKARANAGNEWAVEFVFDRIFGKPGSETDRAIVSLVERLAENGEAENADRVDGAGDGQDDTDGDAGISAGGTE